MAVPLRHKDPGAHRYLIAQELNQLSKLVIEGLKSAAAGDALVAGGDGSGSFAGAGAWATISDVDITDSRTEHKIQWDESVYSDIVVVVSGIQSATDLLTLRCSLGENGTMHETTGDYTTLEDFWTSTARTLVTTGASSATPRVANNTSNVSGEVISGTIWIGGVGGANGGCFHSIMFYQNSSGVREVLENKVFLDDNSAAGQINTYRLTFATLAAFANVGNITTLGLKR